MIPLTELSIKERNEIFNEAEGRIGVRARIIEKDFWVCWILDQIFSDSALAPHITFKGGTSLSKGYDLIKRFSEDVDLTISKAHLGVTEENDPIHAPSRKNRDKRLKELVMSAERFVSNEIQSILAEKAGALGDAARITSSDDKQTLLFYYPTTGVGSQDLDGYIQEVVRLEFGVRGDSWPTEKRKVTPMLDEVFGESLAFKQVNVNTMIPERTFWEKILILHAEAHRPLTKSSPERFSRHYYDVVMLARNGMVERAITKKGLLSSVITNKSVYFPSAWTSYETATPGSIRLLPGQEMFKILKKDYSLMQPMFLEKPPSFDIMMSELSEVEKKLNLFLR